MFKLINGDSLIELDKLEENSIDSIVTDPPYEIGFMNKKWDSTGIAYSVDFWKKCFRVLKPGGYLLSFSAIRTQHKMTTAIEDAGFEIRDVILWMFGSAMPKGQNVGKMLEAKTKYGKSNSRSLRELELTEGEGSYTKIAPNNGIMGEMKEFERKYYQPDNEWNDWNSVLKPAYEPVIMARKPLEGTIAENIMKYHTGALNIGECRISFQSDTDYAITANKNQHEKFGTKPMTDNIVYGDFSMVQPKNYASSGRYPANIIHDGSDEVIKNMPNTKGNNSSDLGDYGYCFGANRSNKRMAPGYDDEGSAARYFYCAKASSQDREEGLEHFVKKPMYDDDHKFGYGNTEDDNFGDRIANVKRANTHVTVKPCDLMKYLVRLISPKGATILDPFMGSGSTGKAIAFENKERDANYSFIGIEKEKEYCEIAQARIDWANDYKEEIESNVSVNRPKDLVIKETLW